MVGIHTYSTTASENVQANTGINWDEGMPPSAVNNSARQNMADIRGRWNDAAWFQYGIGSKTVAPAYASGTSVTFAGGDATVAWHTGRRVKATGSSTGTIYGKVSSSSYNSGTTTTTVNFTWDTGSLSNEALTVYLSAPAPVTGMPIAPESIGGGALNNVVIGGTAPLAGTFTALTGTGLLDLSGASAGQIKFPATQNASANANTLDDYEEGTFTPTMTFGGNAVGITYGAQVGRYTKIGNEVRFTVNINLTAKGSSTGTAAATGLPFTSVNSTGAFYAYPMVASALSVGTTNAVIAQQANNSISLTLANFASGGITALSDTNCTNTTSFNISGVYETAT